MKNFSIFSAIAVCLFLVALPCSAQLNIVSTTSVLADPLTHIGGDHVKVIIISDPTICPHMQSDVIQNNIQMQKDFILNADMFVAHNGSVDIAYVMPFVDKFMEANGDGSVNWTTLSDPAMVWNTPDSATALAAEVKGWLVSRDPANAADYEKNFGEYADQIRQQDVNDREKEIISGQDVIVMVWQRDAAEQWLGLNVVAIYAPEFYMGGKFTAAKLVDDINAHPDTYRNVSYVIENMQSGELGKGIEEALNDKGIPAKRVIFTNFPGSLPGVATLPDVLSHNKEIVTPADTPLSSPTPTRAPAAAFTVLCGILGGVLVLVSRK
jgi:zinc/manganese transport system substrate-binding protein